jgi:hypothetical protein
MFSSQMTTMHVAWITSMKRKKERKCKATQKWRNSTKCSNPKQLPTINNKRHYVENDL